ncbi:hypothetical protein N0V82_008347 [Gnomoniopsis sp. IMI 355080]|nr:hypothetical protein N0V82_008347 [Gnomoniopsis sp. IMI 355080]
MFGEEKSFGKEGRPQLPRHVLEPWTKVCKDLGRPVTGRVPADDVLNNAVGNASFSLTSTYFGLPEERLSAGLQGTMEGVFAPALSAMALAQSGVLADQPDLVAHCLESLASRIVKCALVFQVMTPRDTAHFDPVVWIKTYPAMGRAVTSGELGNSGVDAPLFHALDAFIGRQSVKGDLSGMQNDRRATLPANIRAFLNALSDEAVSVKEYVAAARARVEDKQQKPEQSQYRHVSAAWDGLLQIYVWFLERHRVKAVGITGVSLNTGRHSTSSGVSSGDQAKGAAGKTKMRPETMLSMQMKAGMASRLGGRPLWQDAHVQSRSVYHGSVVVTIRLDARLPIQPGDRVQVWPPKKRKRVNSLQQRRSRSSEGELSSSPEDHDMPSSESDDDSEPRFYSVSIARVEPEVAHHATQSGGGGGMTITLTVGQHSPEGLVSSFLSTAAPGTQLRIRPWPSPNFRQPRDLTVPLVMIGQGSGVGPFVGFLHERAGWAQRHNEKQDDISDVGEMILVVAAKTRRHVPCPLESLEQLTRALPLTIVLALGQEAPFMIRSATWTQLPRGGGHTTRDSLKHRLLEKRVLVQRLVKEKGGHVFVCGSSDFGATVMSSLGLEQPRKQHQQKAKDANDESYDNNSNHTTLPLPPAHWGQLHLDLFTSVAKRSHPSRASSSSCSYSTCCPSASTPARPGTTTISPSTLAAHNSISSCWTAIHGTVYDITSFLATHPGGPKTLLESAGTIADARFDETHGGPHAQEIMGYLQPMAIGCLSSAAAEEIQTQTITAARLIDALVRIQNALTNNTVFTEGRGPVPMYVYADALLVFADGLDGLVGILSSSDYDALDSCSSKLRESLIRMQTLLRKAFVVLKEGCKGFLVAAGSEGSGSHSQSFLDESEDLIRRLYKAPIDKLHEATDSCKKALGEICDARENRNDVALRHVLEKFCISLTSVAKDLLY